MTHELTFDALSESTPGPKWQARWARSWPAYRDWFEAKGGATGPDRASCEAALRRHMPELVPVHRRLTDLAGGGDLAARFLSTWCPPGYLGACSLIALSGAGETRLLRNYDLSPDLNEGLLLHSAWTGTPVMGMVEFLWGLSDGINGHGLAVTLAYGGSKRIGEGFGICTIVRYVLEVCRTVDVAVTVLKRVPSHMDYNLVLADATGRTASVEVHAGGGATLRDEPIATNHQLDAELPDRAAFTRTVERRAALARMAADTVNGDQAVARFLEPPLFQTDYDGGFGTLFTAVFDPERRAMALVWPDKRMSQRLDAFEEQSLTIRYAVDGQRHPAGLRDLVAFVPASRRDRARQWMAEAEEGHPDWAAFGALFVPDVSETSRHGG